MNYTLAGLRERVLIDKLDDEDFDTSVIDGFINDAQRDVFSEYELPFTEKIFSGNLPAGATMFEFPDDVSQLQAVIVNGFDIKQYMMDFNSFRTRFPSPVTNQAGGIRHWSLYGGKMLVDKPTDQEYNMTIYYNKVPKKLVDATDIPELPEEFEELLVLGAFYRVQFREGDSDEALVTKSEYQRKLEQLVNRKGFRISGPIKMKNRQVGR